MKISAFKKIIAMLLCLIIIASMLVACDTKGDKAESDSSEASTTTEGIDIDTLIDVEDDKNNNVIE